MDYGYFTIETRSMWRTVLNYTVSLFCIGFPGGSDGRVCLQCGRLGFNPWVGKIPWRRKWQSTPGLLPGKFHGQGSWQAVVHGVTKSQTQLSNFIFTFILHTLWLFQRILSVYLLIKYSCSGFTMTWSYVKEQCPILGSKQNNWKKSSATLYHI